MAATAVTTTGERLIWAASSGRAIRATASAMFVVPVKMTRIHSFRLAPGGSACTVG